MKLRFLRGILGTLGIAGIIAFLFFPKEKHYECLEKDQEFYLYGDQASGVASAELQPVGFKCELLRENGLCGIGFSFTQGSDEDFKNWNLMDSLILYLESSANFRELIVQVLTYDPDHTDLEKRGTMKPVMKELKLSPGKKRYSIYMEHLYTPDYWFEQQNARDRGNMKRFSAIAGLEMFSGWANKAGEPLSLKIENICLNGQSNVPFVVLVCFLGILIIVAIGAREKKS
jgi:hypothetical protein